MQTALELGWFTQENRTNNTSLNESGYKVTLAQVYKVDTSILEFPQYFSVIDRLDFYTRPGFSRHMR